MSRVGMRLADEALGVPMGAHIHLATENWSISSAHPITKLGTVAVLDRVLPGLLGSFFYPSDAVFAAATRDTTRDEWQQAVTAEEERLRMRHTRFVQINPLTFERCDEPDEEEDDPPDEEYDESEPEDDADDAPVWMDEEDEDSDSSDDTVRVD